MRSHKVKKSALLFPTSSKFLNISLISLMVIGGIWRSYHLYVQPASVNQVDDSIPVPTNLVSRCSDDGTQVVLSWDDVTPGKYHFAVNDPSNDNATGWYIAGTTDVWRGGDLTTNTYTAKINPDRSYKWWVQSNLDGPGTDRSAVAEATFMCASPAHSLLTSLTNTATTCNSLSFGWDKIEGAQGYLVDLADNVSFSDKLTSFNLPNTQFSYTFQNLKSGTVYYARITQTHISDFPQYTKMIPIKTLSSCVSPQPLPTPKPSARASVKPSAKPSASPSVSPSPIASEAGYIIPQASPSTAPASTSFFSRFFAWLFSLFR